MRAKRFFRRLVLCSWARNKINFSLDVPGNRKSVTKPVPEAKNVSTIEPPAGHMTCTSSTVYIGDPIIMDGLYDGHEHSSSGITFIHHTSSFVFPLSLLSYQLSWWLYSQFLMHSPGYSVKHHCISLHLILASLPLRFKYTDNIHRQQILVEDETKNFHQFCWGGTATTKAMRSSSIAALPNGTTQICHLCI